MPVKETLPKLDNIEQQSVSFEDTSKKLNRKINNNANKDKQHNTLLDNSNKDAWERIGNAAEAFNTYYMQLKEEDNLNLSEVCSAVILENYNLREFFPRELGGTKTFDDTTYTVYNWYTTQTKIKENSVEPKKVHYSSGVWERIAKLTEDINKYNKLYATDYNLSETDLSAAMLLVNLNLRNNYPEELGGITHYDNMTFTVYEWFENNKHK